jgi:outer membrane lipase/esterase
MLRTRTIVSAIALALASISTAQAQEFSDVINFGDSLTDAGNVALIDGNPLTPPGSSFTTNPDPVYAQIVANAFGASGINSLSGGSDYAYGGACVRANGGGFTCGLSPGSFSITSQVGGYLLANGGHADGNALYTMWGGANDIFTYAALVGVGPGTITAAQAQQLTGLSALTEVALIGQLQAAGAQNIVVLNLPNLGATPQAAALGASAQGSFAGLSVIYNSTLNGGLATLADGIIPINAYGFLNEVLSDPGTYGFTNTTGTACGALSGSLACGPASDPPGAPDYALHYAAGANYDYVFADGVHPTGHAHALLGQVVLSTIAAPGQVSMAGELPLQVYENHSNVLNQNIFSMNRIAREPGESNVYGSIQYGRSDYDATVNTAAFDSNVGSATLGAVVRYSDHISLGAAISFGNARGDSFGSDIDGKEVLVSAYGVMNWNHGYILGIASGGSMSLDIERNTDLFTTIRTDAGNTSASHLAFELGGGFTLGNDNFRHGPYASLTNQRVRVSDYAEDSVDSTAMWFSEFTRRSFVTRLGYQAMGNFGSFHPYGRIAYARDTENDGQQVQAGSNTMNGHFTLDGYIPSEHWYEGDVGVEWDMNDDTTLSFAWRGHFNDDAHDVNTLHLGVRWEFGGAAAPVEAEPAPEAPAQTCADLDDDGDGINNCDDKCPASASGEAVGADGCPVPAEQPAVEPKPYRG